MKQAIGHTKFELIRGSNPEIRSAGRRKKLQVGKILGRERRLVRRTRNKEAGHF